VGLHVIIDGYNLIRRSGNLGALDRAALELGRDALVDRLAKYKRLKRHKITVVFDGSQKYYFPGPGFSEKGIGLKFSRHGENADGLIIKMAQKEREKAVVISSDHEVCRKASLFGAAFMSSEEFLEKLEMTEMMDAAGDDAADDGWSGSTVKKGPSRRLPKRLRRVRRKREKL